MWMLLLGETTSKGFPVPKLGINITPNCDSTSITRQNITATCQATNFGQIAFQKKNT